MINYSQINMVLTAKDGNLEKIFGYVVVQPLSNREDIIDCYYITVIPTILGSGIRLFEKTDHEIKLRLLKTQSYNGMTDLIYTKR